MEQQLSRVVDLLEKQQRANRYKTIAISAALLTGIGLSLVDFDSPHTALVKFEGEITSESSMSTDFLETLKSVYTNPKVTGIIVYANSPGGSPALSDEMYNEIRYLKSKHKKPLSFVVGEACASGCYYVAVAADKIVVNQNSLVGSIGVVSQSFGFDGLFDTLGVEVRVQTAGENKAHGSPFLPETDDSRTEKQLILNQIHANFIEAVRQGRGDALKYDPELFTGLVWTGNDAVDIGLADSIGSIRTVLDDYKSTEIRDYTAEKPFFEGFSHSLGVSFSNGLTSVLKPAHRWF